MPTLALRALHCVVNFFQKKKKWGNSLRDQQCGQSIELEAWIFFKNVL